MSLPRYRDKLNQKAFIEPADFIEYLKDRGRLPKLEIPKNVIFLFQPSSLGDLDALRDVKPVRLFNGQMRLVPQKNVALVTQFGFGAPALVIQLELLIASGVTNFIGVGTSGSLIGDVKIGDLVLCNKALRDEGASYHYAEPTEYAYPGETLCEKIRSSFRDKGLAFHELSNWTTDAVFRETLEEVHEYRAKGIHTVDMEASALFAVAEHRGVQAASLFAISDMLTGEEWVPHFHSTAAPLKQLLEVAIEAFQG